MPDDLHLAGTLDQALAVRLRQALDEQPATEADLRLLAEQAEAWTRALEAQVQGSERRLDELSADPEISLAELAVELRRLEELHPELEEMRSLLTALDVRARELRTGWLLHQADSQVPRRD